MHAALVLGLVLAPSARLDVRRPTATWFAQDAASPPAEVIEPTTPIEIDEPELELRTTTPILTVDQQFLPEESEPEAEDCGRVDPDPWRTVAPEVLAQRLVSDRTDDAAENAEPLPQPSAPTETAFVEARLLDQGNEPPVYPQWARRRGHEGEVTIEVTVSVDGLPLEVRVAEPSPYAALDRAAVRAVGKWRFAPARRGGVAEESRLRIPVVFQLQ